MHYILRMNFLKCAFDVSFRSSQVQRKNIDLDVIPGGNPWKGEEWGVGGGGEGWVLKDLTSSSIFDQNREDIKIMLLI